MPIIDLENPGLAAPIDTPKGFAVTPGATDIDHGQDSPVERPAWSSTMAAAFRQDNTVGALFSAEDRDSPIYKEPGFSPWEAIKGTKYEPHWSSFTDVRNTRAADERKRQIDLETEDKKTLAAAPWYQRIPSELLAGGLDIPTLLPGGAFAKGVNGGIAIAKTAANVALAAGVSSAAQETALQNIQATREASESVTNVGASVLLGGLLGAAGARLLSGAEWSKGVEALNADIAKAGEMPVVGHAPQSVGAAAHEPIGIEGNSIAGAVAGTLASATSRINPALRILESPSAATREIGTGLFENSLYLKKNFDAVASEPAVETLMKEWNGGLAKSVQSINEVYPEFRKAGGDLTHEEFREAVGKAMRRGDQDPNPHVQKVAQEWRANVFDPLKEAAIKAGLLPKDVSVETAQSYFSRMWNKNKLIAQEGRFKAVVQDWVEKEAPGLAEQFDRAAERRLNPMHQEISALEMEKVRRAEELSQRQASGPIRDTRNAGIQYHGTSQADLKPDSTHYSTKNYYGQGFYTTDAVDIAHGYSKRGAKTDADRRLYRIEHDPNLKIFDGEQPLSDELLEKISPKGKPIDDVIEMALDEKPKNLRELYDEIRDTGTAEGLSADSVQELFDVVNHSLQELGYKGFSHAGGLKTKSKPHKVVIYFEPDADLKIHSDDFKAHREDGDLGTSEMSEGDIRQALRIVTAGAPRPKGVKTLSQFVLENGGLVDDAGELAHRGITNKARPGLIRKERRTAQSSGGGWTLDDMARHAWENGYFPESNQRPSIDQFVEALNDDFHKVRAVLKHGDQDAFRLNELVAQLEADLSRAGVGTDGRAARFSTSEEMKGAVERVYKALDAEADRKIAALKDRLNEREADIRVDRESRFLGEPKEMARDVANEVFNTLTGKTVDAGARPEFITVKARGPLKERTFNIPDHLVEDFLESDVEHVGRRYARVMGADVELANKYGSVDMKDQIAKIREDYANLRAGVTDEKTLTKLGKQESADVRDIEALRDLLRGTRQESPIEQNYGKLIRSANHVNYIRSMGEVVLASLTDTIRPAMVHGLTPFIGTTASLATNLKAVKMSVHEAQLAGNVAEAVLGHRLATLSEIGDPYAARGPIEAFLENMTNVASKWNGIRMWTDGMKSIASVMTQNRILKGVESYASLPAKERAYLAFLGIDQSMAERIAAQYAQHGENLNGVRVANTERWGQEAGDAVALRTYRAAINKDVDSIIIQKSVADVPLFASTPTGKMLLQFKSFTLASHQKILLRGLQEDQARFIGGVVAMTTMGMFQTWLKAVTGNRTEKLSDIKDNPGWWIGEGLDRAGVIGPMMEVSNSFEKIAGINPIKAPIRAFDVGNAVSQKNQNRNDLGAVLGPTFGLVQNAGNVLGIPQTLAKGEEVSKAQKNSAVQLMPFNSYFGVRQLLNYVVNPPQ